MVDHQRHAFAAKLTELSTREARLLQWERSLQEREANLEVRERRVALEEKEATERTVCLVRGAVRGEGALSRATNAAAPVPQGGLSWDARLDLARRRLKL